MRPLWDRQNPEWRSALYYHYYEYPYGWHFVNKHEGIRTDRYKLIHFYEMGVWELYDLEKDPQEMNNLLNEGNESPLTDSLKAKLEELKNKYDVEIP